MKSSENAVVIWDLNYYINQTQILKNINLTVKKGELVGLIGPNGAGKTTLLKCINGINRADGIIELDNKELRDLSNKNIARKVALMNQNTAISFPFPTIDVVLMGRYPYLKRLKIESKEDYEIAHKQMEYTDTMKFEKKPVTEVSGGERQRIMLAKVLTQDTDVILFDEPTASLDITFQEQIFSYLRELSDSGRAVIVAVHDLKIASRFCSRLVLMRDGEIMADGSVEQVLVPENLSTAYGINALVYKSSVTGHLDFYIYGEENGKPKGRVHVIGGGGSASGVMRQLFEKGFKVSAGVFAHGDSDLKSAEVFGIERLEGQPFTDISDEKFQENIELIESADFAILCNMPFGIQNMRNLEAAGYAKKLIIIEDDAPEIRDFTDGRALKIYNKLKETALITTTATLHEVI